MSKRAPARTSHDEAIAAAMMALLPRAKAAARLHARTPVRSAATLVAATAGFANACAFHRVVDLAIAKAILAGVPSQDAVVDAIAKRYRLEAAAVRGIYRETSAARPTAEAAARSRRASAATTTARRSRAPRR